MTAMDLLCCARERISLTVIVFADGAFGQIRTQRLASYGASHGVTIQNPDFGLLALALGVRHKLVGDMDDIESIARTALSESGVTVVEVPVQDAFPMVRVAATARARELARRTAGPRVFSFVASMFRRLFAASSLLTSN